MTFSWSAATCPTGYTVSKYSWTVTGGKDSSGATSGDTTSTAVNIQADAAGSEVSFTYTVTCGSLAASETSDAATATWTVQQPSDEPDGRRRPRPAAPRTATEHRGAVHTVPVTVGVDGLAASVSPGSPVVHLPPTDIRRSTCQKV